MVDASRIMERKESLSVLLEHRRSTAGDFAKFGEDLVTDGDGEHGVTKVGSLFSCGLIGQSPIEEFHDLLSLHTIGHAGGVEDDVGVTSDGP